MFAVSNLAKRANCLIQQRYKSKTHWAKLRKKTGPTHKALHHFDDFYASVFGKKWEPMRTALLRRAKYVALVNNYGNPEETIEYLTNRGAHCLNKMMQVQNEFQNANPTKTLVVTMDKEEVDSNKLETYAAKLQSEEISNIYTASDNVPEKIQTADITLHSNKDSEGQISETSEQPSIVEYDESRIIDPELGVSSEALWQYVPATKLKGMDEWIPESIHYSYYSSGKDFPLVVEPETDFTFPEHLKVYTYEMSSDLTTFPEPKRTETGVFNYYPMNGGSVLPVLALCLNPGDRVLDLCSAPGGKALVMLQTFLPDIVVCNDSSLSRINRLRHIFNEYFFDFETSNKWRERVLITNQDGRAFVDDSGFDKVLVDVPCTTDRLSLTKEENNIFRPDRIKERLNLPEMQSQLLVNALRLVRPGGAIVYSTCSLSPIQNDGVVHMALRQAFEIYGILATVKDMTKCFSSLSHTLRLGLGSAAPRYGQLVMPHISANFGPMYFSRLVRTK